MRGIYSKLYAKTFRDSLSDRVISILKWWMAAIREFRPTIARPMARMPDSSLQTGSGFVNNRIAYFLPGRQSGSFPDIEILAVPHVPKYWEVEFYRPNMIYGLEML